MFVRIMMIPAKNVIYIIILDSIDSFLNYNNYNKTSLNYKIDLSLVDQQFVLRSVCLIFLNLWYDIFSEYKTKKDAS